MGSKNSGKVRVVDGKLLVLKTLQRRMLALGVPVDGGHLSHIFCGRRDPSYKMFKAMAKALGLSLDELDDILQRSREDRLRRVGI